jgi:hypothetical protein
VASVEELADGLEVAANLGIYRAGRVEFRANPTPERGKKQCKGASERQKTD